MSVGRYSLYAVLLIGVCALITFASISIVYDIISGKTCKDLNSVELKICELASMLASYMIYQSFGITTIIVLIIVFTIRKRTATRAHVEANFNEI